MHLRSKIVRKAASWEMLIKGSFMDKHKVRGGRNFFIQAPGPIVVTGFEVLYQAKTFKILTKKKLKFQ